MKNHHYHRIFYVLIVLYLCSLASVNLNAQCINGTEYIGDTVEIDRSIDTIATDIYTIEFSTIAGITNGSEYKFTCSSNIGDTTRYITITDTFNNVLIHGTSPLFWTATFDGVIRAHYTDEGAPGCSGQQEVHTNTVQCVSCGCFNVIEYGGGIASSNDSIIEISDVGIYTEEYAPISGINSGSVYLFNCKEYADSSHKYITITDTNDSLLASGYSPLEWEATITGNIRAHYTEDDNCSTTNGITHLATIRCISCPPINDLRPNAIELPILSSSDSCDYNCIGQSAFLSQATADPHQLAM